MNHFRTEETKAIRGSRVVQCERVSKLLERFLERTEFDSYEDFKANYRLKVPEDFNFGYDIVDGWAKQQPDKIGSCLV